MSPVKRLIGRFSYGGQYSFVRAKENPRGAAHWRNRQRALLFAGVALGSMLASTVAFGATDTVTTTSTDAAATSLQEVTVTARRRAENLQTVPVAVTAVSGATLQRHNISDAEDIQYLTPSLSVQGGSYNRLGESYSIRGTPIGGTLSYRDEVPGLYTGAQGGSPTVPYFDIAQVQVLKGPQGTLFGSSSTGGAILVTSKAPTDQFGGYLQGTYGNYDANYLEGALNIPIVDDKILLRVSGSYRHRDGYTHNIYNNTWVDNQNTHSIRAVLKLSPSSNFTNTTVFEYNFRKEHGGNAVPVLCNPAGSLSATSPLWYPQCLANAKLGARTVNEDLTTITGLHEYFLSNVSNWNITPNLLFKNVFGYIDDQTANTNDNDGTSLTQGGQSETTNPYPQWLWNDDRQWSEEAQVQGKSFGGALSWIAGGFYENYWTHGYDHLLADVNYPFLYDIGSKVRTTESAIFAQGTLDLQRILPGLQLTGGVRGTWDQNKTYSVANACTFPSVSPSAPECLPLTDAGWFFDTASAPPAPFSQSATFNSLTGQVDQFGTLSTPKSNAATSNVTLDYKPVNEIMMYLAWRTGYRPGGVNNDAATGYQVFLPETITDIEGGVKSEFRVSDIPVRANLAVFSYDYRNIQRTASIGPATSLTVNAEKASFLGLELEASIAPVDWLLLDINYAYLHASFDQFTYITPGPPPTTINATGSPFPLAPANTLSFTANIKLPIPQSAGRASLMVNYSYRDRTYLSLDPYFQPELQQGPYGLINAQAEWDSIFGSHVDAILFAKNLANTVYVDGAGNYTYNFNPFQTTGIDTVYYGEPRTFGLTLRYTFGGG